MFRRELIRAAEKSFARGELSRTDLLKIRVASLSPRVCVRLEEAIREQLALEKGVDAQEINWDAIGDFLVKIWPLLLQLIEMIGGGA